jgi:GNAT superfamily N-acetyltransferase
MADTVRRATLHDLDQLVPLFDAYRQFYGQQTDLVVARKFLSERLARNESVALIVEDHEGTAIGFAQLYPTFSSILAAPMFLLSDLFVTPPARRHGVGSLLMKAAAETARAAGAVRLELATAITNTPAQKLYEALGWKRDEEFCIYGLPLLHARARDGHE